MEVHHIGYLVKNMNKAIAEFRKIGFIDGNIVRDEERGVDICFAKSSGGYCVELISPYCKTSDVSNLMAKHKNSPYHICYVCEDIERTVASMCDDGYMQLSEIKEAPAIDGRKVCFLINANIGIVELVEEERQNEAINNTNN